MFLFRNGEESLTRAGKAEWRAPLRPASLRAGVE